MMTMKFKVAMECTNGERLLRLGRKLEAWPRATPDEAPRALHCQLYRVPGNVVSFFCMFGAFVGVARMICSTAVGKVLGAEMEILRRTQWSRIRE